MAALPPGGGIRAFNMRGRRPWLWRGACARMHHPLLLTRLLPAAIGVVVDPERRRRRMRRRRRRRRRRINQLPRLDAARDNCNLCFTLFQGERRTSPRSRGRRRRSGRESRGGESEVRRNPPSFVLLLVLLLPFPRRGGGIAEVSPDPISGWRGTFPFVGLSWGSSWSALGASPGLRRPA